MSVTIRSFNAKIGADTSEFIAGLKGADREIRAMTSEAAQLKKALAIKFDEKQFVRAQETMRIALSKTNEKAESIRSSLKSLEQSGKIDSRDYQVLTLELIKTESKATILESKLEEIANIKINNLSKKISDVGKSLGGAGRALMPISAGFAGIGVAAIKSATDTLKAADDIATSADKYAMSSKAIQNWQYVAMQSDVPADRLFKASSKARDAFGSQMIGEVSNATKALSKLGINIKNFDNSEDAFMGTIESLSAISDTTLQAKYANDIFGEKIATDLLPLFAQGEDAIKQYNEEFESMGYMTEAQIEAFGELDNEFNNITAQMQQAKFELGVALLPVIKEVSAFITESIIPAVKNLVEWFGNLPIGAQKSILAFVAIAAVAAPVLIVLGKLTEAISVLVLKIPKIAKAIELLGSTATRSMIGIGALVAAVVLISQVAESWGEMNALQKAISVLGILTVVALGAAVAMGAFHSAWSLGLAVAGIVAGIAAVTIAINSAKNGIEGMDVPDFQSPSVTGGGNSYNMPDTNRLSDTTYGGGNTYEDYTNNSVYNPTVVVNVTNPNASASEIADAVGKQLALKFATGR